MYRFRRRLFFLAAVLATATVYHLTRARNWEVPRVGEGVEALRKFGFKDAGPAPTSSPVPLFTSLTALPVGGADPTLIPDALSISKTASSSTGPTLQDFSPSPSTSASSQTRSSSHTSTTQRDRKST